LAEDDLQFVGKALQW